MDMTPLLEYYNRIICTKDEAEIHELNIEIQSAIMANIITDSSEIMLLNMALQIKSNFFLMKELMMSL